MKEYVCGVCGYVYKGEAAPDKCPQCGAAKEKFSRRQAARYSGRMATKSVSPKALIRASSRDSSAISRGNAPRWGCTWP